MSKGALIILLGLFTAFLPFTGFPEPVTTILAVVFGLATLTLGFLVRQERIWLERVIKGQHKTDAYAENGPARPNPPAF